MKNDLVRNSARSVAVIPRLHEIISYRRPAGSTERIDDAHTRAAPDALGSVPYGSVNRARALGAGRHPSDRSQCRAAWLGWHRSVDRIGHAGAIISACCSLGGYRWHRDAHRIDHASNQACHRW